MNVKSIGIALLVLVAASFALMGNAAAATYYVNPGDSIQATINGAADGDTIVLCNGDYVENVVVNKSVAIMSCGMYQYYHSEGWTAHGLFWWTYYYYQWDYTYEYDDDVQVAAADDRLSVFTVESDDVLIMNIQFDYSSAGSYCHTYTNWFWWTTTCYTWDYHAHDNPMCLTGAYKSDAAGVTVNDATGTQLINLVTYGNDNGILLDGATNTYIEDVEMVDNHKEGLVADGCDGIEMYDCVVVNSGKRGVEIENSANVVIEDVLIMDSGKDNMELVNVAGVSLFDVVTDGTSKNGMSLEECTDVEIIESAALNSGRSGLYMTGCDGGLVDFFEAADNGNYGLKIMYTDNMDFTNIDAHDNGEDFKHHDCTGCTGLPV